MTKNTRKSKPKYNHEFAIKRVKNGYVLTNLGGFPDEMNELVYQEPFEEDNEFEAWANFLWFLTEQYGPTNGKYNKKNVHICVIPGRGTDIEFDCPLPVYCKRVRETNGRDVINWFRSRIREACYAPISGARNVFWNWKYKIREYAQKLSQIAKRFRSKA